MDAASMAGDLDPAELGKLRWRCRRGMKELDVLLTRYVDEDYRSATPEQRAAFRELLETHDPRLLGYFLERESPTDPVLRTLIQLMTARARNAR